MINSCLHENFSGGIGDFLRGSVFLCQYCTEQNREFSIDFGNHPLGQYIVPKANNKDNRPILDLETYQHTSFKREWHRQLEDRLNHIIKTNPDLNISSYYHPVLHEPPHKFLSYLNSYGLLDKHQNILNSFLRFSNEVEDYALNLLEKFNISDKNFDVIHFRLGDMDSWSKQFRKIDIPEKHKANINFKKFNYSFDKCIEIIHQFVNKPTVVLSDNNGLKELVFKKNIPNVYITHLNSIHSSTRPGLLILQDKHLPQPKEDIFYIAVDMYLLSISKYNRTFSVYDWGSGFPYWISKIHNIPVKLYKL